MVSFLVSSDLLCTPLGSAHRTVREQLLRPRSAQGVPGYSAKSFSRSWIFVWFSYNTAFALWVLDISLFNYEWLRPDVLRNVSLGWSGPLCSLQPV